MDRRSERHEGMPSWSMIGCGLQGGRGMSTWITTGSKGEGLTRFLESDIYMMLVTAGIMCIEDCVNSDFLPRQITVFTLTYTIMSYHGHCRLFLKRPGIRINQRVHDSLCDDENGRPLLCSDLYVNAFTPKPVPTEVRHNRSGPSIPGSM
ncbi:hypothetical protein DPMN_038890 [Dreissena polymorpha]|uniref:Uncharacterized protein n=1 Tax=Dreissena polymorpha TaxID=45954 RepID=A0A9D4MH71_DREPO|nr:hypothetical protein DPMN_038890 [Dreissena polymorpha]